MAARNDRISQMAIGHLCQNSRAQDGDIRDMTNISVSEYPVLKPREPFRYKCPWGEADEDVLKDLFGNLVLAFSDADTLYYLFERNGVNDFVATGTGWQYVLFVGKIEFNSSTRFRYVVTDERITIGGHAVMGSQIVISDAMGKNWLYFNTATASIGSTAQFPENVLYLCVANNRVWGCTENGTIYASKLGDATSWYTFENISTDSWSVDMSVAMNESVNGCAVFNDRPVFFTETKCITVYGDYPSTFSTYTDNVFGVMKGCGESIAEVNGYLYYLSPWGFVRYNSGGAALISDDLNIPFDRTAYYNVVNNVTGVRFCVGGSSGTRYYACINGSDKGIIYTFDIQVGLWTISANEYIRNFIECQSGLYALKEDRKTLLYISGGQTWKELFDDGFYTEVLPPASIEFAPIFEDAGNRLARKWLKYLRFRVYMESSQEMDVTVAPAVAYSSEDEISQAEPYFTYNFKAKKFGWYLVEVPCTNTNCDAYTLSLKFSGGNFRLRAISREFEILR